jgi:hypothetical protein
VVDAFRYGEMVRFRLDVVEVGMMASWFGGY